MIEMTYDEGKKEAIYRFSNGREFRLGGITRAKAEEFRDKHAPEFERRNCILQTDGTFLKRERYEN